MSSSDAVRFVSDSDPVVVDATDAVQHGDLARLDALLATNPWLSTARFGDEECHRTLLHAAVDHPGHFPNGPAVLSRLIAAGADVNARSCFDSLSETALHWAASSGDVRMLDALLDAGADIEAVGAAVEGGTALSDACEFGNWAAAQLLLKRGAHTRLKEAAALGVMDRLEAAFAGDDSPGQEEASKALFGACAGGQLAAAAFLVERGANVNWLGWDDQTPLDAAERAHAVRLAEWLLERGARRAAELG
ncbi:MAG: ankyrin repeat domain-containing protein [Acidimicrobiales bacterium]